VAVVVAADAGKHAVDESARITRGSNGAVFIDNERDDPRTERETVGEVEIPVLPPPPAAAAAAAATVPKLEPRLIGVPLVVRVVRPGGICLAC
jgi:hypothetical protein